MSPFKPKRPCPGKGQRFNCCPNLIGSGEQLCPECVVFAKATNSQYDKERDQTEERRWIHSPRWRDARDAFLANHPLCIWCWAKGQDTPATLVDHIVPHQGNYDLFWDQSNWQSLCNGCHEEKHKRNRWGGVK